MALGSQHSRISYQSNCQKLRVRGRWVKCKWRVAPQSPGLWTLRPFRHTGGVHGGEQESWGSVDFSGEHVAISLVWVSV